MCILVTLWSGVAVCVLLSDHTRAGDNLPGWGWEVQRKVQDGGTCLCRSRSWQRCGQVFTMTTETKSIMESGDKFVKFLFLEFSQYMLPGYVSSMVLHNLHRPFKPGWHSLCNLGLLTVQFMIACCMQKWRGEAWLILSREWCHCLPIGPLPIEPLL